MRTKNGFGALGIILIVISVFVLVVVAKVYLRVEQKNTNSASPSSAKTYSDVFSSINKIRADAGLAQLKTDDNLCAYAKRRALQYQERGDSAASIFQTDGNDKELMKTYFAGFGNTVETYIKAPLMTDEEVAKKFSDEPNKGAIKSTLTHGCVSDASTTDGTGTWVVFIGSTKK